MTLPTPRRVTDQVAVLLAPNPGPMTLDGTNSYLLSAAGAPALIVVDPGPDDDGHLAALAAAGRVELILITHRHPDHTAGAAGLSRLNGAPIRSADPAHCSGGEPLADNEIIEAAGIRLQVLATPGHTADSVCFLLSGDGSAGSVLTGDTILGRGTTVIAPPDGSLGSYLASLRRLADQGPRVVLPAHGPEQDNLLAVATGYLAHREQRLAEIQAALGALGQDATVGAVTDRVYDDIDPSVRRAAEHSVAAQLDYLRAGRRPAVDADPAPR